MIQESKPKTCSHGGCDNPATLITWLPNATEPRFMEPTVFCAVHRVAGKRMWPLDVKFSQ